MDEWYNVLTQSKNGAHNGVSDEIPFSGMDVLNPVQTSAANMLPALLKERCGKEVVFWGGAYDSQIMNPAVTYDEVYRQVYNNVKPLAAGGNYIFSDVHKWPVDLSDAHLKAMPDAYKDDRRY